MPQRNFVFFSKANRLVGIKLTEEAYLCTHVDLEGTRGWLYACCRCGYTELYWMLYDKLYGNCQHCADREIAGPYIFKRVVCRS